MKGKSLCVLLAIFTVSCSSYTVRKDISESGPVRGLKAAGYFVRISNSDEIDSSEYLKNIESWMQGYEHRKKIMLLNDTGNKLRLYPGDIDRFYQRSISSSFLKYKSLGVITLYLRSNRDELKKLMADNGLDSLVIYEIDSAFSAEMQFIDFNSSVLVVDRGLKVLSLDHQSDSFDIDLINREEIQNHLLDKISERFVERMVSLGFVKKK